MSKCFGNKVTEKITNIHDLDVEAKTWEWRRQHQSNWDTEFQSTEQYVLVKLKMLYNEMFIVPTEEEIAHLYSLKTEGDINRAVASIIDRAWD